MARAGAREVEPAAPAAVGGEVEAAAPAAVAGAGGGEVEAAAPAAVPGAGAVEAAEGGPLPRRPGALEDERDFCLRSLRDLDAEWEAGDIDEADYRTLKDAYTARAAVALHALDGRPAASAASPTTEEASPAVEEIHPGTEDVHGPTRRRRAHPRRRTAMIGLCVVAAAGAAAWAVVASSATRLPGEEVTGAVLGPEALAQSLQHAQQAADRGDDLTAVKDYQKILDSDPNQIEALTGEGWLLAQTEQPSILQQGLTMLQQAERVDPTYSPAHVYRGIALLSEGDYTSSIPELKWYLAHSPDPQLAPRVRAALQQDEAQAVAAARAAGH